MADTWRVGIAGLRRGRSFGRLLIDDARCELAAICDTSQQTLEEYQEETGLADSACFTDFDEMLGGDLDIVCVATPILVHAQQSIAAMEAGCHVLSEVTMAPTIDDCQSIIDTARRTGCTYMLAENMIFFHFVPQWKELVESGSLGQIVYSECEYLHPIPQLIYDEETGQKHWRAYRAPLHYCSHSLGPILHIIEDRIVRACGLGTRKRVLDLPDDGAIDLQVALFETEAGMIIKLLRTSLLPRGGGMHFFSLQGTKGFIESERSGVGGKGLYYAEGVTEGNEEIEVPSIDPSLPESARAGGHGTAEYSLLEEFFGALEEGRKPCIDAVRGADMTVPGLIAHESAMRDGEWLEVPHLR